MKNVNIFSHDERWFQIHQNTASPFPPHSISNEESDLFHFQFSFESILFIVRCSISNEIVDHLRSRYKCFWFFFAIYRSHKGSMSYFFFAENRHQEYFRSFDSFSRTKCEMMFGFKANSTGEWRMGDEPVQCIETLTRIEICKRTHAFIAL